MLGTDGVHWLLDSCADLPLDVFFMASSCVPASEFESPRRPLSTGDLESLMRRRRVIGLAEMMNFPGVVSGFESELAKLELDGASHVDGHAPGVLGKALNAYASAGIRSDHEARTIEEGRERLRAGHVAPDPGGVGRPQPARPAPARPTSTGRTGSPSAPTTASRSTSPTRGTSTRWCGRPSPRGSRPRTRS